MLSYAQLVFPSVLKDRVSGLFFLSFLQKGVCVSYYSSTVWTFNLHALKVPIHTRDWSLETRHARIHAHSHAYISFSRLCARVWSHWNIRAYTHFSANTLGARAHTLLEWDWSKKKKKAPNQVLLFRVLAIGSIPDSRNGIARGGENIRQLGGGGKGKLVAFAILCSTKTWFGVKKKGNNS